MGPVAVRCGRTSSSTSMGSGLCFLGGRLIQPPVGVVISALSKCPPVVVGSGCLRCLLSSSGWERYQASQSGRLIPVDGACVPWETTAALPEFDKSLSLALVAPDASVKVVVMKCLFGACELMWALRASEEDHLRQWWCD